MWGQFRYELLLVLRQKQDDIINFLNNAATIIKFEQFLAKIVTLGAEILHPSLVSKSHGYYNILMAAYKNLMEIEKKIQHAEIQENALNQKFSLKSRIFSSICTTFNISWSQDFMPSDVHFTMMFTLYNVHLSAWLLYLCVCSIRQYYQ